MGLEQHIRQDDFISKLRMFARIARVLMVTDVIPWKSIKPAPLNVGDIIRRHIIAKQIALVDRGPQCAGLRLDGQPDSVANTPCIDFKSSAVGIEFQYVRSISLGLIIAP